MKYSCLILLLTLAANYSLVAQTKNFIDQPYIDVKGYADSFVVPNEIFIKVTVSEKDTKDRVPLEVTEENMVKGLKDLEIDTDKDLSVSDLGSNYRYYILKQKDIIKSKTYTIKVTTAVAATKVFMLLEDLGISNSTIDRVDYSDKETVKNTTRSKAVENARRTALRLTSAIGQNIGPAIYIGDMDPTDILTADRTVRFNFTTTKSSGADKYQNVPKIEFDRIKISTTLSVKFIIR